MNPLTSCPGCPLQDFAEKLLARLQKSGNQRFETRLAMMRAVSRVVGVHRLILLNFYPFLQKYIRPHQHDVTHVLAALIQVLPPVPPSACDRQQHSPLPTPYLLS